MNIIKFVPGIAGKTRECNALIGQNVDQSNSASPHVHIFKKLEPINKKLSQSIQWQTKQLQSQKKQ